MTPLVARLARERMALTVCPLSNLRLRVVQDLKAHPLRRMMDKDLVVTLNSDDPAYFGGYVNDNYRAVSDALSLNRDEIAAIVRNGFHASLMSEAEKQTALAEVERCWLKGEPHIPLVPGEGGDPVSRTAPGFPLSRE